MTTFIPDESCGTGFGHKEMTATVELVFGLGQSYRVKFTVDIDLPLSEFSGLTLVQDAINKAYANLWPENSKDNTSVLLEIPNVYNANDESIKLPCSLVRFKRMLLKYEIVKTEFR